MVNKTATLHQRKISRIEKLATRIWESVERWSNPGDGRGFKFKIISYNVLAQILLKCHPTLYQKCSSHNLGWKVRSARLYKEIMNLDPDILCLQEVQESHIKSFYSKFEDVGYCGVFKLKTGKDSRDGCAIYYKRSMFHLEDHISVEMYQPGFPLLDRNNVGLIVRLRPRCGASPLVVATTHLLFNPKRTDVRLAQMQLLLAEIDRFAYRKDGACSGHYPIILTGDFNSTPDSPVIELLNTGHVSASKFRDNTDWRRIGVTDNCQHLAVYLNRLKGLPADDSMLKIFHSDRSPPVYKESEGCNKLLQAIKGQEVDVLPYLEYSMLFNSGELSHGLQLASAYDLRDVSGRCEVTTFQKSWVTVDYIYYSTCSVLKPLQRLRLPTELERMALGALPSVTCGSDHLSLAALFELGPPAPSRRIDPFKLQNDPHLWQPCHYLRPPSTDLWSTPALFGHNEDLASPWSPWPSRSEW